MKQLPCRQVITLRELKFCCTFTANAKSLLSDQSRRGLNFATFLAKMLFFLGCIILMTSHVHDVMGVALPSAIERSTVVEMSGWGVSFPSGFNSDAVIALGRAGSSKDCLGICFLSELGCRFVSFDLDTRACTGYKRNVEGTFTKSSSSSLLAVSTKSFYARPGLYTANADHTNEIIGADGRRVANGGVTILSPEICLNLCRIHPRCHTAFYFTNNITAQTWGVHWTDCGLTTGSETDVLRVWALGIAFVS